MNKKVWIWGGVVVIVAAILILYANDVFISPKEQVAPEKGVKDIAYLIDGNRFELVNGRAEMEIAPDSASKIVVQYFGNEAEGDLDGDGIPDRVFLVTQTTGGSGTFFYAVGAIKTYDGYQGTSGIFLGDRIAPQTTEIRNGEIIINYAERGPNEPMTAQPSIGVSKILKFENGMLVEGGDEF